MIVERASIAIMNLSPTQGVWLAQAAVPPGKADPASVLIWVMVFIAVVIGMGLLIMLLRRKLLRPADDSDDGGLLASLRKARDRGTMSHEEYDQAKRVLAARAKDRMLARDAARANPEASERGVPRRASRTSAVQPDRRTKPSQASEQFPPSPDNAPRDDAP
jgi:hypothetical protein